MKGKGKKKKGVVEDEEIEIENKEDEVGESGSGEEESEFSDEEGDQYRVMQSIRDQELAASDVLRDEEHGGEEHNEDVGDANVDDDIIRTIEALGGEIGGGDGNVGTSDAGGQSSKKRPKKPSTRKYLRVGDDRNLVMKTPDDPFPGGPVMRDVLSGFYDHVALRVWVGNERGALKCVHHSKSLMRWKLGKDDSEFADLLKCSGFASLKYAPPTVDKALISAFVERWHSETSSFHLPFGEMTITLEDVSRITGLNIEGEMLSGTYDLEPEEGAALVKRCLGFDEAEILEEFATNTGSCCIRLSWLHKRLEAIDDGDHTDEITRGYLLYAIGTVLCPDKSGNKISVAYLKFLEKLEDVDKYAWGAIALAFLYKELNSACRGDVLSIAGFLGLLEAWIHDHFWHTFPRNRNKKWTNNEPRMYRWAKCGHVADADAATIVARGKLDKLKEDEVVWDPYIDLPRRQVPDVTFYEGSLRCLDIKVPHMPNRVLRQFGFIQTIPCVVVDAHGDYFSQWRNHVVAMENRTKIVADGPTSVDGYLNWFLQRTHPCVQNPDRYTGPAPAAFTGKISTGVEVDKIHYCVNALKKAMEMGKKECGKVWPTLVRVHDTLLTCGAGAPPPGDEEEEQVSQSQVRKKRKTRGKK